MQESYAQLGQTMPQENYWPTEARLHNNAIRIVMECYRQRVTVEYRQPIVLPLEYQGVTLQGYDQALRLAEYIQKENLLPEAGI